MAQNSWGWPSDAAALETLQLRLARAQPVPWRPEGGPPLAAGLFLCAGRSSCPPPAGWPERAWAAAALIRGREVLEAAVVEGWLEHAYVPGLLALREGPLLASAVAALSRRPEVLVVNATGRDHPRRAGLALHLGAVLDLPTVGVTDRPLVARMASPAVEEGATVALTIAGEVVAAAVRTARGVRPVVVHPGWRTDLATATEVVLALSGSRARTPLPLRAARQRAREARAVAEGRARAFSPLLARDVPPGTGK